MMRSAIADDNPVICIEHRWMYDVIGPVDKSVKVPLGKAHVLRKGKDVTVVTTSWMAVEALLRGVSGSNAVMVLDPRAFLGGFSPSDDERGDDVWR